MSSTQDTPTYRFSEKYNAEHAKTYFHKHNSGFWRRLSTWREIGMARSALALAGNPKSVLDLPCGTGRFWEMLCELPERTLYVADNSRDMLDTGLALRPAAVTRRIAASYCCSAFDTGLPEKMVDCVFSIRFLHHIQKSEDRIAILREFARLSKETVIVSLWVDGNFRAWRMKRKQARKAKLEGAYVARDRILLAQSQFEHDVAQAGLEIVGHVDFIKHWDKWRSYVLRVKPA